MTPPVSQSWPIAFITTPPPLPSDSRSSTPTQNGDDQSPSDVTSRSTESLASRTVRGRWTECRFERGKHAKAKVLFTLVTSCVSSFLSQLLNLNFLLKHTTAYIDVRILFFTKFHRRSSTPSSQYCWIISTRPLISEEYMRKLTNVRKELRNLTIAGLLLEKILQQHLFARIFVPELSCQPRVACTPKTSCSLIVTPLASVISSRKSTKTAQWSLPFRGLDGVELQIQFLESSTEDLVSFTNQLVRRPPISSSSATLTQGRCREQRLVTGFSHKFQCSSDLNTTSAQHRRQIRETWAVIFSSYGAFSIQGQRESMID